MKLTNANINDYVTLSFVASYRDEMLTLCIKGVEKPIYTSTYFRDIKKALGTIEFDKIKLGVTKSKKIYIYTVDKYGFMKNIKYIYRWAEFVEQAINDSLGESPREDFFQITILIPVVFLLPGLYKTRG